MRQAIFERFKQSKENAWAKGDDRYLKLAELDALLDGELYNCLPFPFYQETKGSDGKGDYVPIKDRRPSFQFNLFNMVADQLARKLFAGARAPRFVHPSQDIRLQLEALREEAKFNAKMIEAVHWGSVGSVAMVFQIVPFEEGGKKRSKVVVENFRSKQCTPIFNKMDELVRLTVHFPVKGCAYLNAEEPIKTDYKEEPIKDDGDYWWVQEFNSIAEIVYRPIPLADWAPQKGTRHENLIPMEETKHDLGFVPAHWYRYRTGKTYKHDGKCYWDPAVPNIIDLDYTVSQIGSGVRYNAVPQAVVKGDVVNTAADGGLGRGASRFIQLKADQKDSDFEESGAEVSMLEAKGEGMKIGLEHWASLVLRIAMQQICASLKDPNKITTAMSGVGMQILESEFLDLSHELRTIFGDDGSLKFFKKMAAACQAKKHALMDGISIEQIDALTYKWPPLSSIGMVELQSMALGLVAMVEAQIFAAEEAREYASGQIDMPISSANKDYLPTIKVKEKQESEKEDEANDELPPDPNKAENAAIDAMAEKVSATSVSMINRGPLDTRTPGP